MSELWRTDPVANGVAKAVEEREARCIRKIGEIGARGGHIRARCLVDTGHPLRDRVATSTVIRRTARRSGRNDTRRRDASEEDR